MLVYKKIINIIFLCIVFVFLIMGLIFTIVGFNDINIYENRNSHKVSEFSFESFSDERYQDDLELALSDQIPFSVSLKKIYNNVLSTTNKYVYGFILKNNCNNRYIKLSDNLYLFGCDNNVVVSPAILSEIYGNIDKRVANLNKIIEITDKDIYFYYVETSSDIDLETSDKSNVFEYLGKNVNSNNLFRFKIDSVEDFKKFFYKTDHHWNHIGSYKAYTELVNIITNDDNYVEMIDEVCLDYKFLGSRVVELGSNLYFEEKFCVYKFNLPNYDVIINGEKDIYYNFFEDNYISYMNINNEVKYSTFYGSDYGEIIIDNNDFSKENILIIGESYDNAILKLLASHFNKTIAVDLRYYNEIFKKEFNYLEYLEEHSIDKVLFIGSLPFFNNTNFDVEV